MSDQGKTEAKTKEKPEQAELSEEQLDGAAGGINGNSPGAAEIDFAEVAASSHEIAEIDFVEVAGTPRKKAPSR